MNLDTAVQIRAQWKTKLRAAISKREQLDLVTLSRDARIRELELQVAQLKARQVRH